MLIRSLILAITFFVSLSLAGPVSADPSFTADVFLDGELLTAHLKKMPEGATAALLGDESVGRFFVGMSWECFISPPFGVCFQHPTIPVVASRDDHALLQSFEIFFWGQPWRPFVSWDEIEEAVASGEIDLVAKDEIYKITIPEGNRPSSGKMAESELSWGGVKALFR